MHVSKISEVRFSTVEDCDLVLAVSVGYYRYVQRKLGFVDASNFDIEAHYQKRFQWWVSCVDEVLLQLSNGDGCLAITIWLP